MITFQHLVIMALIIMVITKQNLVFMKLHGILIPEVPYGLMTTMQVYR